VRYNIKVDLKETEWKIMGLTRLAQARALVNMIVKIILSIISHEFLH
jgi:hypothetical protein